MTKNNNGLNYKLHEFLGTEEERQKLWLVYVEFFNRSKPLSFKFKTLSQRQDKYNEYFKYLTDHTKIIYASQDEKIIGFISFDLDSKTLNIPNHALDLINPKLTCEFVFAASKDFDWNLFRQAAFGIFQLIKLRYNVKYIAGNIRRHHKKRQFIATAQRLFNFKFAEDFAYYEIP